MTVTIGRRDFLAALGGAAAWPLAARAQQAAPLFLPLQNLGPLDRAAKRWWLGEVPAHAAALNALAVEELTQSSRR